MSDIVTIPFGDNAEDTAVLLLDAAIRLEQPASVVTTGSFKTFQAPKEVAESAGVDYVDDDTVDSPEVVEVTPTLGDNEPDRSAGAAEQEEFDPSDHTVAEVLAYLEQNPDQREAVIAVEREGKDRTTITESQE